MATLANHSLTLTRPAATKAANAPFTAVQGRVNDDTDRWIDTATQVCQAAARGDLEARILEIPPDHVMAPMLRGINHLLDMTDAFVREATASLTYASQGHFFRRVLLEGMLGTFRRAAEGINTATEQMESNAVALRAAQAERVKVHKEFEQTLSAVQGLHQASQQIGEFSQVIDTIASRTNLLALNATIESARVGEAGAGFAVVAAEVKKLASQTAGATKQIETQVNAIQDASTKTLAAIERIWQTLRDEPR